MRAVLAVATSLVLGIGGMGNTACAPHLAPVYAPSSSAGLGPQGRPYTIEQVGQAVVQGAIGKGWTVVAHQPGLVVAEVMAGGHSARVRVVYNESGWRIDRQQTSPGLKYRADGRDGEIIHHRYNLWIRHLDQAIRSALVIASLPQAPPAPSAGNSVAPPREPPAVRGSSEAESISPPHG